MYTQHKGENLHSGHRKRVKAKALDIGFGHLDDHQLLELLLFYSIPREDTNALAHRLLNEFGSLNDLLKATPEQIKKVSGAGENTALLISAVSEISQRSLTVKKDGRVTYKTTEDYKKLAISGLQYESVEKVFIFCFDTHGRMKKCACISQGDKTSSYIDVAAAVKTMVESDCKKAIIAHNHPTGNKSPSAADIDATRSVSVMFRRLGFVLADHIIVGGSNTALSMYEDSDFSPLFF